MNTSDPGASRWRAHRCIRVAVHVLETLRCQPVDIWRVRMRIAVAPDPIDIVVFAGKPEDVRAVIAEQ